MYPGGYSWQFLVGVCRPVSKSWTYFRTKKCHFPDPFSGQTSKIYTHFQTWPLGRNYVIITQIRSQTKNSSAKFRIRKFFFLSYSFGIETILIRSYTPVVLSKTIPDSRPKRVNCIPVFRPKRRKNPTRWGGTYLYSLFMGVLPPNNVYFKLFLFLKKIYTYIGIKNFKIPPTRVSFALQAQ